jgi:SAM-dependent methyltransferase
MLLDRLGPRGRVVAVDENRAFVELAHRRALDDAGRRLFHKTAPLHHLPFADGAFDVVVGSHLTRAVTDVRILPELRRVLAPSGSLWFTVPIAGAFCEIVDMVRELDAGDSVGSPHAHPLLSLDELAALLRTSGYRVRATDTTTFRWAFRSATALFNDPLVRAALALSAFDLDRWGVDRLRAAEARLSAYAPHTPVSLTIVAAGVEAERCETRFSPK